MSRKNQPSTIDEHINVIYETMVDMALEKKLKYCNPEDFKNWSLKDEQFNDFFKEWQQRNFGDRAMPWISLLDKSGDYLLGNIKWMGIPTSSHLVWEEIKNNNQKKWDKIRLNPKLQKYCAWNSILSKYGLKRKDWNKLVIESNGRCMLLGEQFKNASNDCQIDHDHVTGKVRGLLCARCNHLLAGLDDKEFNKTAQLYLNRTNHTLSTSNSL